MKQYTVITAGVKGFRRSGIAFSTTPIVLSEEQMTPEIMNEPMLIVTEGEPKKKPEPKSK